MEIIFVIAGKSIDEIQKLFGAPTVTDDSEESRK